MIVTLPEGCAPGAAASRDTSRPRLAPVWLSRDEDGEWWCVATDSYVMAAVPAQVDGAPAWPGPYALHPVPLRKPPKDGVVWYGVKTGKTTLPSVPVRGAKADVEYPALDVPAGQDSEVGSIEWARSLVPSWHAASGAPAGLQPVGAGLAGALVLDANHLASACYSLGAQTPNARIVCAVPYASERSVVVTTGHGDGRFAVVTIPHLESGHPDA